MALRDSTKEQNNRRPLPLKQATVKKEKQIAKKRKFSIKEIKILPNANENPHIGLSDHQLPLLSLRQDNIAYIVGLPRNMMDNVVLTSHTYYGQFGKIKAISFNPNLYDDRNNIDGVYIIYLSNISAAKAVQYANSCTFNDGRKVKATFGTQRYCTFFIKKQQCDFANCQFLHFWCRPDQVVSAQEMMHFNMESSGIPQPIEYKQDIVSDPAIQAQLIQFQRNDIFALQEQLKYQKEETEKWKNMYTMMQHPYNALFIKYEAIKAKYNALKEEKRRLRDEFKKWNRHRVYNWIMSIDNGYFEKYVALQTSIANENIDGSCLPILDGNDLERLGIKEIADRRMLIQHIVKLMTAE